MDRMTLKSRTWRNVAILSLLGALLLNTDQASYHIGAFATSSGLLKSSKNSVSEQTGDAASFGDKLAAAALERTNHYVIYNPKYMKIDYPGGDVPAYFGVCSDVVIRSYRALGIDLQERVHETMGGDSNIAHRRVRVLRKYLARYGKSLTVSRNPDNFKPGDIVTYYLPDARFSKDHIAIVSSRKTLTGRPLIIHNIGFGPKIEDQLFAYKITGHYRYSPKVAGYN
jgi:uncharacterized protein YijF (DUF1287 family)